MYKMMGLLLACTAMLAACGGDFKNTKVTTDNQLKVIATVNAKKKVTEEDAKWFRLGTEQFNQKEGSIVGHTVAEVIKAGSDFEKMGPAPAASAPVQPATPAAVPAPPAK